MLSDSFDRFRSFADKSCSKWDKVSGETIKPSVLYPRYNKLDKITNQARAITGKLVVKTALSLKPHLVREESAQGTGNWIRYGKLFEIFTKLGIHEWNAIFLPGYTHPKGSIESTVLQQFAQFVNSSLGGFAAWRARLHPDCTMAMAEQANRVVWFALLWTLLQGRPSLSPSELDAIWNYAMLYPYIDNYLDSPDPEVTAHHAQFIQDLRRCIETDPVGVEFLYHPQRTGLISAMKAVKAAAVATGPLVVKSIQDSMEILIVVESGPQRFTSLQDALFVSAMKGALALIPVCSLVSGFLHSEQYQLIFDYGLAFQLIDDLQDFQLDRQSGKGTVFTWSGPALASLDQALIKTMNYLPEILSKPGPIFKSQSNYLSLCTSRMLSYLAVEAVILNAPLLPISYPLMKEIKQMAPFGRKFMASNGLERKLHRLSTKLS